MNDEEEGEAGSAPAGSRGAEEEVLRYERRRETGDSPAASVLKSVPPVVAVIGTSIGLCILIACMFVMAAVWADSAQRTPGLVVNATSSSSIVTPTLRSPTTADETAAFVFAVPPLDAAAVDVSVVGVTGAMRAYENFMVCEHAGGGPDNPYLVIGGGGSPASRQGMCRIFRYELRDDDVVRLFPTKRCADGEAGASDRADATNCTLVFVKR